MPSRWHNRDAEKLTVPVTVISLEAQEEGFQTPIEGELTVRRNSISLVVSLTHHNGSFAADVAKFSPFRGPKLLQRFLTPFYAITGILPCSHRDIDWLGWETDRPYLRFAPAIDLDYFFEVAFMSRADAELVREQIELMFGGPVLQK